MGITLIENGVERTVSEDLKIALIDVITQEYFDDAITEALRSLNCQSLLNSSGQAGRQAVVIVEYIRIRDRGYTSLDTFSENDLSILLTVMKKMKERLSR